MGRRHRRGSNAIEFALTLPIFVILFSGMIDFSWYFFSGWRVSAAVREGLRVGSLTPLANAPEEQANKALSNAAGAYQITWASGFPVTAVFGSAPDCGIRVEAQADVKPLIGLVRVVPTVVAYEAVMRLEDQTCKL